MTLKSSLYSILPDFALGFAERIEASPIGYRLARGAFWSLAGALISRGLALVSSILVARLLGDVGFGELGIVQSTVGMFGAFAGFGLGLTATKHVAEFRNTDPDRAGRFIALSTLLAVITGAVATAALLVLAPWLAEHSLAAPRLSGALRAGGGMLFLGAVTGAQSGALAGFEAFRTIATVSLISGLATFPLLVGGTLLGGLHGAVWGLIASMGVSWVLNHRSLHREAALTGVPIRFGGWSGEWPTIWKFSLPAALSGALAGPVYWACTSMLVNQPHGYGEMGVFTAASQWRNAILFLPSAIGAVVLPVLAGLLGEGRERAYLRVLLLNTAVNTAMAAMIALPVCALAGRIMAAYGPGFSHGIPALTVLSLAAIIASGLGIVGQAIASQGKMWEALALNTLWAAALLLAAWWLVDLGARGLALATLFSYCVHFLAVGIFTLTVLRPRLMQSRA